jgi:hypothetical protein
MYLRFDKAEDCCRLEYCWLLLPSKNDTDRGVGCIRERERKSCLLLGAYEQVCVVEGDKTLLALKRAVLECLIAFLC